MGMRWGVTLHLTRHITRKSVWNSIIDFQEASIYQSFNGKGIINNDPLDFQTRELVLRTHKYSGGVYCLSESVVKYACVTHFIKKTRGINVENSPFFSVRYKRRAGPDFDLGTALQNPEKMWANHPCLKDCYLNLSNAITTAFTLKKAIEMWSRQSGQDVRLLLERS